MTVSVSTMGLFPGLHIYLMFILFVYLLLPQLSHKQTFKTSDIIIPVFSQSLFRLIGIVDEACLPSNAYFSWTPDDAQ